MPRQLSDVFLSDLRDGFLAPLRERVLADSSLCLEIRDDYINVYYRGGNLMKLARDRDGYAAGFDTRYFRDAAAPVPESRVRGQDEVEAWLAALPALKQAMDLFPKDPAEREIQQLIVRDNNFGAGARATDFYVCDIEYASDNGRFDLVAVRWPSTTADRKRQAGHRLVLGEVKQGDAALDGSAGVHAHVINVNRHLEDPIRVAALKQEMVSVFNQKRSLGLIDCEKDLSAFSDDPPVLLLAFANHDPAKSRLVALLRDLPPSPHAEIRIASASLLGYGLYDDALLTQAQALARL